jgi:hypothetical protein
VGVRDAVKNIDGDAARVKLLAFVLAFVPATVTDIDLAGSVLCCEHVDRMIHDPCRMWAG